MDSFLEESSNSIENQPYSSKFIESRLEREVLFNQFREV